MFRRLWEKLKLLWTLAKTERAAPREIFWAVFVGVFAGCTPAVGFHGGVAIGLATICRKNRLFAWIGSRISNMVFLPFIAIAEIELSHRVRTGAWVPLDRHHVIDQAHTLILDWCLGMFPVGGALGLAFGALAWWLAVRRDRRRAEGTGASDDATPSPPPSPSARPRPSSGSPA